ncbi:MAG: squalene/phytoene synthase family protein [Anaerolineales bacterium]|jgi:phytoene/squalene synthetase
MDQTALVAQSITRAGSKQAYYTARLMVDRPLVTDFFKAYAYFRWIDDFIDITAQSDEERISFIKRQRTLIDGLYGRSIIPGGLCTEEMILVDLIHRDRDREHDSGLRSFIENMFAIIEFDAYRKGRLISEQELAWYHERLGISVTEGLQYFIGNDHVYPQTKGRYLAATAAHIVHLLRDMIEDVADGFINIPGEYLEAHGLTPESFRAEPFRYWVRQRVEMARDYFKEGKRYFDQLDVLRCKIVGYWYCARFEAVLTAIERDGYVLRKEYDERKSWKTWARILFLGIKVTLEHVWGKLRSVI